LPGALIGLAIANALWRGWGHWGDPLADTGRELEWPRRILAGEGLYADLYYNYGPLAPYLNALWFRLFGVRLEVLAAAGAATAVLTTFTLYAISRKFVGRLGSATVAVSFVYVCAFAHIQPVGTFNWVLPHAYPATYGMFLALLSLLLLIRHLHTGDTASLLLSIAALALTALAKVEALLPALGAHCVYVAGSAATRRPLRRALASYAVAAGGVAAVYGWFYARTGPALWRDHLAGAVNEQSMYFIMYTAGLDDIAGSSLAVGKSAVVVMTTAAVAAAVYRLSKSDRVSGAWKLLATCAACCAIAGSQLLMRVDLLWLCTPFLFAAIFVADGVSWWRHPERRERLLPALLVWTFFLASIPRIILMTSPVGYGYYLLPGGILALGLLLFSIADRLQNTTRWLRAALATMATALMIGNALSVHQVSTENFDRRSVRVETARGNMWVTPAEAGYLVPILRLLRETPPDSRILALPHASCLSFLSERQGCDGMGSHFALDFHGGFDDRATVSRWSRRPPELVVWFDQPMGEFGDSIFGLTYAQASARWLVENYREISPGWYPIVMVPTHR
jgi:4-amino-4-deoxy-L-arabinose transferase-like glycosyltransferase